MQFQSFLKKKRKLLTIILIDLSVIFALILYFAALAPPGNIKISGIYIKNPGPIDDFKLIDNVGKTLTKDKLKGQWTLVFFGFTNCPMICPTTLQTLKKTYGILEKDFSENKIPRVLFISVDPARDSIEKINHFVKSFHANFIGARATIDEIRALQKQLHTAVSSNPNSHGLDILLLNPEVKVQAYFSSPILPLQLANDIKAIVIEYAPK
ncbi:SCO1/SenC [Legionella massiliensis]|uniref:SCO1/SenC n=1 Tax=Legionella massiliensis TaxID=1034943 RepID=A0A078KZI1_9GAMM|nr:SCO family protein [Legionella massiliensis]CDZ77163.1 SCO1/SenC [Legionella massiliensis]CEE12901.1 SCO1/SenC [Legionella massiliensis]